MTSDRGSINLTVGIFVFFGTLGAGAMMYLLLNQAVIPMVDIINTSTGVNNSSRLSLGFNRAQDLWDFWAFFVLVLASILGLTTAAFSGRRVR